MSKFVLLAFALVFELVSGAPAAAEDCKNSLQFRHTPQFASNVQGSVIFNGLTKPRGIVIDSNNNILVVDRGVGLLGLTQSSCGYEKRTIVSDGQLNHGIELDGNVLYASTDDEMYAWNYSPGDVAVSGERRTIVRGMSNKRAVTDLGGDHDSRTLTIHPKPANGQTQYVYINRGSAENLDRAAQDLTTGRAQIRRFAISGNGVSIPAGGYDWMQGELVTAGTRNSVGLAFDDAGQFWAVENSSDNIETPSFGDIHNHNPSDELNLVDLNTLGRNYGYPFCYTYYDLQADVPSAQNSGTTATGQQFSINASIPDTWCNDDTNVVKPRLSFVAHTAPLDIKFFYPGDNGCANGNDGQGLSCDWRRHAFVSLHGSWNRDVPSGYSVVRIPWSGNNPSAGADSRSGYENVLSYDLTSCPGGCARPVGLAFDSAGRLFVSSDSTGEIFRLSVGSSSSASSAFSRRATSAFATITGVAAFTIAAALL